MGQCRKTANRHHEGTQCLSACETEGARGTGRRSPRRVGSGLQGSAPRHPRSVELRRRTICSPGPSALWAALVSASCPLPSVSSHNPTVFQRLPQPCSRVIWPYDSRTGTGMGRASPPGLPGQRELGRHSADCFRSTWSGRGVHAGNLAAPRPPWTARACAWGAGTQHTHKSTAAPSRLRKRGSDLIIRQQRRQRAAPVQPGPRLKLTETPGQPGAPQSLHVL